MTSKTKTDRKSEPSLSVKETAVLAIFRKYLMTPGKMLCFAGQDLVTYGAALTKLADRGFLAEERFRGGYSLTETGFATMKRVA